MSDMIKTYTVKAREVKAIEWGEGVDHNDIASLVGGEARSSGKVRKVRHKADGRPLADIWEDGSLTLHTVDGNAVDCPVGAFIMVDEAGHPYPCDPLVFGDRYDLKV